MRRRTWVLLALVSAVLLAGCSERPAGPERTAARPDPCGGERPERPDGSGRYRCTFGDDFTGTTLDTSKWVVAQTPQTGFTTGSGDCYRSGPDNVSVSGGRLHLTSRVEALPFLCRSPLGDFTTSQTAGSIVSFGKFAQTYGRFAFRARFPSTTWDFDSALWMYPQDPKYGAWPLSGEIDVAEWFGRDYDQHVFPSVHYAGEDRSRTTGRDCVVETADSAFHTYAVDWTATSMTFLYDGRPCWQHSWTPSAPFVPPQPFDNRFDLVMTQTGGAGRPVGTSATMDVDWVRAWQ